LRLRRRFKGVNKAANCLNRSAQGMGRKELVGVTDEVIAYEGCCAPMQSSNEERIRRKAR
jgi:hypothetical protein